MHVQKAVRPSIKTNFILNFLRVFSAAIVGMLTMPYINRVLGAEYLGKVEYVNTIINYFVLFSALGIPMYGIREVSKVRDDKEKLFKLVSELYTILFITTIISYLFIFVLVNLSAFSDYRDLIIIMSSMVFLSNIGAEWYFQGIENQKFITIRYIIVRFIIFFLVFLWIKKSEDYQKYAFLLVILGFGANIINFAFLGYKLYFQKIKLKGLNLSRHIKPVFTIFLATVSINIYLQLDIFMIGSISGDKYVGYYALANKLIRYIISFITIIGAIMLPRLSYLYINDRDQYIFYLKKCFNIMMMMAIPSSIYFYIFSSDIISLMGGDGFESAILTMKLLSPLCIIVSIAYFFGFLILYPQNLEKIYTKATIYSASFSLAINFVAIRYFQQNGAATIAVLSELFAIIMMFIYLKKRRLLNEIFDRNLAKIIIVNIILILLFGGYSFFRNNVDNLSNFIVRTVVFVILYLFMIYVSKEKNVRDIINQISINKINK